MLPTVRDIRRSLPPGSPPLGYHFRKWYGRPMSRQQEAILFCLEKQRVIDKVAPYLLVDDRHSDEQIKFFLMAYAYWFSTQVWKTQLPMVVVGHKRPWLPNKAIRCLSSRNVHAMVGFTYFVGVMLDVDRWLQHRYVSDGFGISYHLLADMMMRRNPRNLLIIHGNTRTRARSRQHPNTFAERFRRMATLPDITATLALDTLATNLPASPPILREKATATAPKVSLYNKSSGDPPKRPHLIPHHSDIVPVYAAAAPAA